MCAGEDEGMGLGGLGGLEWMPRKARAIKRRGRGGRVLQKGKRSLLTVGELAWPKRKSTFVVCGEDDLSHPQRGARRHPVLGIEVGRVEDVRIEARVCGTATEKKERKKKATTH